MGTFIVEHVYERLNESTIHLAGSHLSGRAPLSSPGPNRDARSQPTPSARPSSMPSPSPLESPDGSGEPLPMSAIARSASPPRRRRRPYRIHVRCKGEDAHACRGGGKGERKCVYLSPQTSSLCILRWVRAAATDVMTIERFTKSNSSTVRQ